MILAKKIDYSKIINHHFLLYGETNTGKTYFTANFVKYLLESENVNPKSITILEFGPKFKTVNKVKIGGHIQDFYSNSLVCVNTDIKADIIPPRLNARTKADLFNNICYNYKKTSKMLLDFNEKPTPYLIINDISIYLHLGNMGELLKAIDKSSTFLGNSYYGNSLITRESKLLSLIERNKINFLIKNVEFSVFTG